METKRPAEPRDRRPAGGIFLILGTLLSFLVGGGDPGHPAPINWIILFTGLFGAGLAFAGRERRARSWCGAIALLGTILKTFSSEYHWMRGGVPLFDIGAVLALLVGLILCLGSVRISESTLAPPASTTCDKCGESFPSHFYLEKSADGQYLCEKCRGSAQSAAAV
jgi:hypothetical protein